MELSDQILLPYFRHMRILLINSAIEPFSDYLLLFIFFFLQQCVAEVSCCPICSYCRQNRTLSLLLPRLTQWFYSIYYQGIGSMLHASVHQDSPKKIRVHSKYEITSEKEGLISTPWYFSPVRWCCYRLMIKYNLIWKLILCLRRFNQQM